MLIGASGVEVATLVISAFAAAAIIIGGVGAAIYASRSEHRTWLRDLRLRVYSEFSKAGEVLLNTLRTESEKDRSRSFGEALSRLLNAHSDVITYGTASVREVATSALLAANHVSMHEFGPPSQNHDVDSRTELARHLFDFQKAVRVSFGMKDD